MKHNLTFDVQYACARRRMPSFTSFVCIFIISLLVCSCSKKLEGAATVETGNSPANRVPAPSIDAAPIIERSRTLDNSNDSTTKLRATVGANERDVEQSGARQFQFTMYRKRATDGRISILIEFTSPAEERDRDGLITIFPDGQIEGVRYVQSTDSFIVTRDLMSEDALFGLTLQELADGQPEKYNFSVSGEEMVDSNPCYRLEGELKQGVESKFPRVTLLISKQTSLVLKAEFYGSNKALAKTLVVTKSDQIDGHWSRISWTIDNRDRQKLVDFEAVQTKYDSNLSDAMFTREHLKKISSR